MPWLNYILLTIFFQYKIMITIMTLDILQAIFWSATYCLLIAYSLKNKNHSIPLTAICLNFAWETVALATSILNKAVFFVLAIHLAWFCLDLIMVLLFLFFEDKQKNPLSAKLLFLSSYLICIVALILLFDNGYMLLSCFIIDLIMAVAFVCFLFKQKLSSFLHVFLIGSFKLLGDLFAWLFYFNNPLIPIIGSLVLVCNVAYLALLIFKTKSKKTTTK